jgi:hypothetical protein
MLYKWCLSTALTTRIAQADIVLNDCDIPAFEVCGFVYKLFLSVNTRASNAEVSREESWSGTYSPETTQGRNRKEHIYVVVLEFFEEREFVQSG